jgi:hypothetical protein
MEPHIQVQLLTFLTGAKPVGPSQMANSSISAIHHEASCRHIAVHRPFGFRTLVFFSSWLPLHTQFHRMFIHQELSFDPSRCLWGFDESGAHHRGRNHHGRLCSSNSLVTCGHMTSHVSHLSIHKQFAGCRLVCLHD